MTHLDTNKMIDKYNMYLYNSVQDVCSAVPSLKQDRQVSCHRAGDQRFIADKHFAAVL